MNTSPHGIIDQSSLNRKNDFLFRISLKGLIRNDKGEVLVVKESGRTWWDLPGGGMDHDEDIHAALAREMKEEVNLEADFTHKVIAIDDPGYLEHANVWQVRLVFEITPESFKFSPGEHADQLRFVDPNELKDSDHSAERSIYTYATGR